MKVAFPVAKGSRVPIAVDVQTSLLIPASLASVDTAGRSSDQDDESVFYVDGHAAQQAVLAPMVGGIVVAKHAEVDVTGAVNVDL